MAVTGGGGSDASEGPLAARALPRARWMPRITLLGLVSGLFAGLGAAVLLRQYSVEYPPLAAIIRRRRRDGRLRPARPDTRVHARRAEAERPDRGARSSAEWRLNDPDALRMGQMEDRSNGPLTARPPGC